MPEPAVTLLHTLGDPRRPTYTERVYAAPEYGQTRARLVRENLTLEREIRSRLGQGLDCEDQMHRQRNLHQARGRAN